MVGLVLVRFSIFSQHRFLSLCVRVCFVVASEAAVIFLLSAAFQRKHRCKKITEAGLQACHISSCSADGRFW